MSPASGDLARHAHISTFGHLIFFLAHAGSDTTWPTNLELIGEERHACPGSFEKLDVVGMFLSSFFGILCNEPQSLLAFIFVVDESDL